MHRQYSHRVHVMKAYSCLVYSSWLRPWSPHGWLWPWPQMPSGFGLENSGLKPIPEIQTKHTDQIPCSWCQPNCIFPGVKCSTTKYTVSNQNLLSSVIGGGGQRDQILEIAKKISAFLQPVSLNTLKNKWLQTKKMHHLLQNICN